MHFKLMLLLISSIFFLQSCHPKNSGGAKCGTSNGQSFGILPSSNLCSKGTASTVTISTSSYSWSCSLSGQASVSCRANFSALVATPTAVPTSTANPTATPTPTPTPTATAASLPLLLTDKTMIPIPNKGIYPAKNASFKDPITGLTITRTAMPSELTGDYNNYQNGIAAIVYSRYTPVNTLGDYYIVHGDNSTSAWVYRASDNKMMTPLKFQINSGASGRSLGEINELRWDYSGKFPYRIYFVGRSLPSLKTENSNMSFYYTDIEPATGAQLAPVLIRDFSDVFPASKYSGGTIMNDVEGDSSSDSRYWAWMVMNTNLGTGYLPYAVFSYDKTNNQILGSIQRSCTGALVPCKVVNTPSTSAPYMSRPNMVEMSPNGTRVVVDYNRIYPGYGQDSEIGAESDGPKAYLPNFSDPIRIASDATHSGWAWGPNGEEMFVSQNNRNDWIEAVDIANTTTAACKLIASPNSYECGVKIIHQTDLDGGSYTIGYHFGKVYDKTKKGYVYMNTYDSTGYSFWGKNQNILVQINDAKLKASKVYRIGSSYNVYYDYRSEGSGALDFKGENVWTTGNFGVLDGSGSTVKIQLPVNWYSQLSK